MVGGEEPSSTVRSPRQEAAAARTDLDLLAYHARQAREDEQWARHQRRQRTAAVAAMSVVLLASAAYLVHVERSSPGETAVTRAEAATTSGAAAASGATTASPSASGSASATSSPTAGSSAASQRSSGPVPGSIAARMYRTPRSGLPWHSGIWTGGTVTGAHADQAGAWRGTPMDFATVYPSYGTWAEISGSGWAASNFTGFKGRLAYGLPLLPKNRKGQWNDILDGSHDQVFRAIARQLVAAGHGDAAIRMGVEANGYWFPWAVTTDTVDEYKAAFRRIRSVMRKVSPEFTFWVDLNCGTVLTGSSDRLAPLYEMYPGDAVVDGISMDHYNRTKLLASNETNWQRAIAPSWAPGLKDGVDFARAHNKGFAVPEWGLDGVQGPGDSPYFMEKMFHFFTDNADVLVYENYFSEPDAYIKGDLFQTKQNPKSAALYRTLWGRNAG